MAAVRGLMLATTGCCAGHLCDNCATCRRGRCCRRDNPHYALPGLGAWDGPIYGELGVLEDDGIRVECHICGKWLKCLNGHLWKHDVTEQEYKSMFGLCRKTGLASAAYRARLAAANGDKLRTAKNWQRTAVALLTPEQRSAQSTGRRMPLEALKKDAASEHRRESRERGGRTLSRHMADGTVPIKREHLREIAAKGLPAARERQAELLREDPAWKQAWVEKISAAKGGRVAVLCRVCGGEILVKGYLAPGRVTCGSRECLATWHGRPEKRQALRESFGKGRDATERMWAVVARGPCTIAEVARATGIQSKAVGDNLARLAGAGRIVRLGKGLYGPR